MGCVYLAFLLIPSLALAEAIIADHRAVQEFKRIPACWIENAKALTIHYAHTSHGDQVWQGAENLESQYSKYGFARRQSATEGLPLIEDPPALRMYDGNPNETYIEPNGTTGDRGDWKKTGPAQSLIQGIIISPCGHGAARYRVLQRLYSTIS